MFMPVGNNPQEDQDEEERVRQQALLDQANRNPLEDLPEPKFQEDPRREQIMQKMMDIMDRPQMPFLQMQAGRSGEMQRYQALLNEMDRSAERRYNADIIGYNRRAQALSGKGRYVKVSDNALLDTSTGQTVMIDPSKTARGYSAGVAGQARLGAAQAGAQSRENVAGINKDSHLQGINAQQSGMNTRQGKEVVGFQPRGNDMTRILFQDGTHKDIAGPMPQKPSAAPPAAKPGTLTTVDQKKLQELDWRIKEATKYFMAMKPDDPEREATANQLTTWMTEKNIILGRASSAAPKPASPVSLAPNGNGDTGGDDPLGIR